ncbi:phospholipase-like protein [Tanacetum coccineum]
MGFRCGTLSYKESSHSPFCARVFPRINQQKRKKVKADGLIDVFNDDKLWSQLSDNDVVRVCLLIVAELVFIGRQCSYYIPNHILTLVEDIDDWNAYPWGEYLWRRLYEKIVNVVPVRYNRYYKKKIETDPNKKATYNLEGFVWALKIWILETYPNSNIWWQKDPTKTPCGVAWSKLKTFSKGEYSVLFGLVDTPILERPEIVGEVQADQELDLGAVEGNFEIRELVAEVPTHVAAKDAIVEGPKLVDEVRAH